VEDQKKKVHKRFELEKAEYRRLKVKFSIAVIQRGIIMGCKSLSKKGNEWCTPRSNRPDTLFKRTPGSI